MDAKGPTDLLKLHEAPFLFLKQWGTLPHRLMGLDLSHTGTVTGTGTGTGTHPNTTTLLGNVTSQAEQRLRVQQWYAGFKRDMRGRFLAVMADKFHWPEG